MRVVKLLHIKCPCGTSWKWEPVLGWSPSLAPFFSLFFCLPLPGRDAKLLFYPQISLKISLKTVFFLLSPYFASPSAGAGDGMRTGPAPHTMQLQGRQAWPGWVQDATCPALSCDNHMAEAD